MQVTVSALYLETCDACFRFDEMFNKVKRGLENLMFKCTTVTAGNFSPQI